MMSKLFEYFKHVLVIVLDYGQFKREFSRINLRVQQFFYLGIGLYMSTFENISAGLVAFVVITEVLNFVLWYHFQRDGSLQERKKEMLEEVMP